MCNKREGIKNTSDHMTGKLLFVSACRTMVGQNVRVKK